jgi:hypothetical protein
VEPELDWGFDVELWSDAKALVRGGDVNPTSELELGWGIDVELEDVEEPVEEVVEVEFCIDVNLVEIHIR